MIEFVEGSKKTWIVKKDDKEIVELIVQDATIRNKFHIILDYILKLQEKYGKDFEDWFYKLLTDYISNEEGRYLILNENIPILKRYVDLFISDSNLDFNKFIDESKVKKGNILFLPDEIEKIVKLSNYLKIYFIFQSTQLKLDQTLHKKIYNKLACDIIDNNSDICNKIFNIIKTRTYRYNITDKYMWDYIMNVQCKTIDVHVIHIFNFIMNSILVLCEEDKNPITYFLSVVNESIKWFLRSIYSGKIVYDDSVSSEDIQGTQEDSLNVYAYNDTIGKLKGIAFNRIYQILERPSLKFEEKEKVNDNSIVEFQNRISKIKFVSPLAECLVYPVLSKITNIPYSHFKTLSPEHSIVLSFYLQTLMIKVFKDSYKNLISMLSYYPENQPTVLTTYKIKSHDEYFQEFNNCSGFFGFNTKIPLYNILSHFIGRISRIDFYNVFDGSKLVGIPMSKLEKDMIKFFVAFFSNELESEFTEIKALMEYDF